MLLFRGVFKYFNLFTIKEMTMIKRNKSIHIAIAILYVLAFCFFSPKENMNFFDFVTVSIVALSVWFSLVIFFADVDAFENKQGDIELKFISNFVAKIEKLADIIPTPIALLIGFLIVLVSPLIFEYIMQMIDPDFRFSITQLFD